MVRAYPQQNPFVFFSTVSLHGRNLGLAAICTLALLFVMSQLIATDYVEPAVDPPVKVQDVVLPELTRTEQTLEPPVKPVDPQVPPVAPPVEARVTEVPTIIIAPPTPDTEKPTVSVNREPLPVFKPPPRYPRAALVKGMEGYVVVEFTITKSGGVRDVRAVEGYDSAGNSTTVFNRSAEQAAARFKYQPQIEDGVPVERHGVRNRIVYRMAE